MKLCVNCASSKDTPSCTRCWPDFVTAFMTDLRNFYLAGPAVTVSWLLWIFPHATLACALKITSQDCTEYIEQQEYSHSCRLQALLWCLCIHMCSYMKQGQEKNSNTF